MRTHHPLGSQPKRGHSQWPRRSREPPAERIWEPWSSFSGDAARSPWVVPSPPQAPAKSALHASIRTVCPLFDAKALRSDLILSDTSQTLPGRRSSTADVASAREQHETRRQVFWTLLSPSPSGRSKAGKPEASKQLWCLLLPRNPHQEALSSLPSPSPALSRTTAADGT